MFERRYIQKPIILGIYVRFRGCRHVLLVGEVFTMFHLPRSQWSIFGKIGWLNGGNISVIKQQIRERCDFSIVTTNLCAHYVFFFGGGIRKCLKNLCVFKNRFCCFQSWKLQYLVIFLVELSTILWWTFVQSKASGIGIAAGERMVHVLWIFGCFFDSSVNVFACASPVFAACSW